MTNKPRMREGKTVAGGKILRKAMARLGVRKANFVPRMPNAKQTQCTMPGSLAK